MTTLSWIALCIVSISSAVSVICGYVFVRYIDKVESQSELLDELDRELQAVIMLRQIEGIQTSGHDTGWYDKSRSN